MELKLHIEIHITRNLIDNKKKTQHTSRLLSGNSLLRIGTQKGTMTPRQIILSLHFV